MNDFRCRNENCQASLAENDYFCRDCEHRNPTINVRISQEKSNVEVLDKEYQDLIQKENKDNIIAISAYLSLNKRVVISAFYDRVAEFMTSNKFPGYGDRRNIIIRSNRRDKMRPIYEAWACGAFREMIIYGSLQVEDKCVSVYGPVGIVLKPEFVENSVSFLQGNAYILYEEWHRSNQSSPPNGMKSDWSNVEKLVLVKNQEKISNTKKVNFDDLLNSSVKIKICAQDEIIDDFVEAHVFNILSYNAVEKIILPNDKKTLEDFDIDNINVIINKAKEKSIIIEYYENKHA